MEKYSITHIENFDTFFKLLYLINYPITHPCFASFSLFVEVNLRGNPKGTFLALLLNVMFAILRICLAFSACVVLAQIC